MSATRFMRLQQPALRLLFCLLPMLALNACREAEEEESGKSKRAMIQMAPPPPISDNYEVADSESPGGPTVKFSPPPMPSEPNVPQTGKLIRTADIRCQVSNYAKAAAALPQLVKAHQGYISHESEVKNSGAMESSFTIRVPEARFEALISQLLSGAQYVDYKHINAEDVSEEYVDLEARIRARQAAEKRYLELLAQAKRVEDMVAVENQLRQIREEIEVVQGRMKYLNDRVSLSTIQFAIYEPVQYQPEPGKGFGGELREALLKGWQLLQHMFLTAVLLWPLWLALLLVIWLIRWWRRRRRQAAPKRPAA